MIWIIAIRSYWYHFATFDQSSSQFRSRGHFSLTMETKSTASQEIIINWHPGEESKQVKRKMWVWKLRPVLIICPFWLLWFFRTQLFEKKIKYSYLKVPIQSKKFELDFERRFQSVVMKAHKFQIKVNLYWKHVWLFCFISIPLPERIWYFSISKRRKRRKLLNCHFSQSD